jgi:hypothetical protein
VRFIYEQVLPRGVTVHVSGARDSEFDPLHWWETRQGEKLFVSELAGYLVAKWQLRGKPSSQRETSFVVPAVPNLQTSRI